MSVFSTWDSTLRYFLGVYVEGLPGGLPGQADAPVSLGRPCLDCIDAGSCILMCDGPYLAHRLPAADVLRDSMLAGPGGTWALLKVPSRLYVWVVQQLKTQTHERDGRRSGGSICWGDVGKQGGSGPRQTGCKDTLEA